MPSVQGQALRALHLKTDMQLKDDWGAVLSSCDASAGLVFDGVISGTVAVSGVPAHRRVVLFHHRSLKPVASTWSDPVTGAYTFTGLNPAGKYLVVCDDYTQTYNAAVADWVEAG